MITIHTPDGILELARLDVEDIELTCGQCMHNVSLFADCRDCELEAIQEECAALVRKAMEGWK